MGPTDPPLPPPPEVTEAMEELLPTASLALGMLFNFSLTIISQAPAHLVTSVWDVHSVPRCRHCVLKAPLSGLT